MELLTNSEESLARIYLDMGKHERGERHGMLALEYARKVKGEKKALKLYSALAACGSAVESLKRFSEACPFYEEAYTCLQGLYPPGHCELQHASVLLINSLINVSDFTRAETVARSTYAALIDPNNNVDPTSFEVASGARQLAQMCHLNGQRCEVEPLRITLLKEGEELARKALASVEVLFGKDSTKLGQYLSNLADLLLEQEKCDGESKAVLDRAYKLILEKEGLDGFHIMHVNHAYAVYHRFVCHLFI
jgi:tetratricopeptide (TPR) repeat protein